MMLANKKQRGEVSIFIVVFSMLLITVVVIGFTRIMVQGQQQATAVDLSQSAYDSAQAGVEDAKRAILNYQSICDGGDSVACANALTRINSSTCNDSVKTLSDVNAIADSKEVPIQTGSSNSLDQAYTCVKIALNTDDYVGKLSADQSRIVPLNAVSAFNTVQIQWFSPIDLGATTNFRVDLQSISPNMPLFIQSPSARRPPLMRTQLIQYGDSGFRLQDFDSLAAGTSDMNTLFLYPYGVTGTKNTTVHTLSFTRDVRRTSKGSPAPIICSGNITDMGYACSVRLQLPSPVTGGNRVAFLRLTPIYRDTHFRITLLNGSGVTATPVQFNGVQPSVDSTGRANSLFRRVNARVEMIDPDYPYPDAEINISGNLCKDFSVTDQATGTPASLGYVNNCTP